MMMFGLDASTCGARLLDRSRLNEVITTTVPAGHHRPISALRFRVAVDIGSGWPATQSKPKMMDDMIKPRGTPRPRRQDICLETLGKYPSTTYSATTA